MACSRTPKWRLRPAKLSLEMDGEALISLWFEPVRSAEPPTRAGISAAMALIALPDMPRVAPFAPRRAFITVSATFALPVLSWCESQSFASPGFEPRQDTKPSVQLA